MDFRLDWDSPEGGKILIEMYRDEKEMLACTASVRGGLSGQNTKVG
jgi:hypothetical protein